MLKKSKRAKSLLDSPLLPIFRRSGSAYRIPTYSIPIEYGTQYSARVSLTLPVSPWLYRLTRDQPRVSLPILLVVIVSSLLLGRFLFRY